MKMINCSDIILHFDGTTSPKRVTLKSKNNGYIDKFDVFDSHLNYLKGYYLNGIKISADNSKGYCYIWNKK